MSSEQERNTTIAGYVHPTKPSNSRDKRYKTFSEGIVSSSDKEEFSAVDAGKLYTKYNDITVETKSESDDVNKCPVCKEKYVTVCFCNYGERTCKNGHIWYYERDFSVKLGNPHKQA